MALVKLPENKDWININNVLGIPFGEALVIRNYCTSTVFVLNSITKPVVPVGVLGYPLLSNESIVTEDNKTDVWVYGEDGAIWVETQRDSVSKTLVMSEFPSDLYTGGAQGIARRIRVGVGQTGFFAGREFRTFRELNISVGTPLVIRAVVPLDIILSGLEVELLDGSLKLETIVGGTPGGTFSQTLPIFSRNTMSDTPTYTPLVVLTAGGTLTGGAVIDVLVAQTSGQGSRAASVGANSGDERGVGANTYYFKLTAIAAITGVFRARWEERPVGV